MMIHTETSMNYNTPTVRAIARCLGIPREHVYHILQHCAQWYRYVLAVACGLPHKPHMVHVGILQQLSMDFAAHGNVSGFEWVTEQYRHELEPRVVIDRDDVIALQWLVKHKWMYVSGPWTMFAWKAGAIECANWLREQMTKHGSNSHLYALDFSQPYVTS